MKSRDNHSTYFVIKFWSIAVLLAASLTLTNCGGGGDETPPPPEGYRLTVSGGTLNDGVNPAGLVVLATLRDSDGRGPGGAAGWDITLDGPGITSLPPLYYDDGSTASYITWIWSGSNLAAEPGTYRATATDGSKSLTATFTIEDTSDTLDQATLNTVAKSVSWSAVSGAGSYFYRVTDNNGAGTLATSGYLGAGDASIDLQDLPDGTYLVEVYAHTKNRIDLMSDTSRTPLLPSPENISYSTTSITLSGSGSGYYFRSQGGVLYLGKNPFANYAHTYRFALWTSLLSSVDGTAPLTDWAITLKDKNGITLFTDTYFSGNSHDLYWDFSTIPSSDTYTVEATSGSVTLTDYITLPNPAAQLPIVTNLQVTGISNGGAGLDWDPVPGAASYYVNVWHYDSTVDTYEEIAGGWVNTTSASIADGTLTAGLVYDVYVTASTMDMTDTLATPPPTPGIQVDMSDNTFNPASFIAQ